MPDSGEEGEGGGEDETPGGLEKNGQGNRVQ